VIEAVNSGEVAGFGRVAAKRLPLLRYAHWFGGVHRAEPVVAIVLGSVDNREKFLL
jgi:hypothetical protein